MRWRQARAVVVAGILALLAASKSGQAQPRVVGIYYPNVAVPRYDYQTEVFREHIEVVLPPSYLRVQRPTPPLRGFYAWKFTFGISPIATFVFRPDTALSATNDKMVIRASRLYLCPSTDAWVMDCIIPVRATAREGNDGLIIDITEPKLVATISAAKPRVLLRQLFEPGGRFCVDETGIIVDGKVL